MLYTLMQHRVRVALLSHQHYHSWSGVDTHQPCSSTFFHPHDYCDSWSVSPVSLFYVRNSRESFVWIICMKSLAAMKKWSTEWWKHFLPATTWYEEADDWEVKGFWSFYKVIHYSGTLSVWTMKKCQCDSWFLRETMNHNFQLDFI